MTKLRHLHIDIDRRCSVEATIALIGGKWKCVILWHLQQEEKSRFSEIKRRFPNITPRMLTNQLRELEADRLLERKVYAQVPPKVEYSLSSRGRSLAPVLEALKLWGDRNIDGTTMLADVA